MKICCIYIRNQLLQITNILRSSGQGWNQLTITMHASWGSFHAWSKRLKTICNKSVNEASENEWEACDEVIQKELIATLRLHGAEIFRYGGLKSTLA